MSGRGCMFVHKSCEKDTHRSWDRLHPRVGDGLLGRKALVRVGRQQLGDQVLRRLRHLVPVRRQELKLAAHNQSH